MARRHAVGLAALTALVAAVPAAPAQAAESPLGCERAVGNFGRIQVHIGTIAAVRGVRGYADPAFFATRRDPDTGLYWAKAPIAVRKGKVVSVSIRPHDRAMGDLIFGFPTRGRDAVRFTACPRGRGFGRDYSSWPGGFVLTRPVCLDLVARERGSRRVHRATLSFGMGDTCPQR